MHRKYRVELDADAQEQFDSLGEKLRRQIRNKVVALEDNPRPRGARRIYDHEDGPILRVRSGDYRIIYQIRDEVLVVLVITIGLRRDVYQVVKRRLKG